MTALELWGCRCERGALLGTGGMGRVYAFHHPALGRLAVKLLHPTLASDPAMTARILEEARAARLVSHPNVVRILDGGRTDSGEPFVVMEHVRGVPLGVLVQREGPLPLGRVRVIATQILDGLAAIHRAGLVHADMKSDNVLVDRGALADPGGDADRVTIIDFGLARPPSAVAPHAGERMVSGTPEYMAPEQVRGEPITAAADLYAVGVILYEMLTGTTPFGGGPTSTVFKRHLHDAVVPPSLRCPDRTIPAALEAVILRALEKDPAARHPDASQLAAAVRRAVPTGCPDHGLSHSAVAFSTTAPTRDWVRVTGPSVTGPRPTGPRVTGPRVTGPRATGPRPGGPRVTGPSVTGPHLMATR